MGRERWKGMGWRVFWGTSLDDTGSDDVNVRESKITRSSDMMMGSSILWSRHVRAELLEALTLDICHL